MACEVIKVSPGNPERNKIDYAAGVLRRGGLVIFPTDTVYGLGAVVSKDASIRKIYRIKKRSHKKPLIYLIGYKKDVSKFAGDVPAKVNELMKKYWPGPLTLILKARDGDRNRTGFAGDSIGLRMPGNRIALSLIRKAGTIAATSVNISGKKPISGTGKIEQTLKNNVDLIIDGGNSAIGMESTILDASSYPYRVIREGAIKGKELAL